MKQNIKDKTILLARYMGYTEAFEIAGDIPVNYNYLNSLDALHPVAMKVLDALKLSIVPGLDKVDYILVTSHSTPSIRSHCSSKPDNGLYIDLFNVVYEAIVFLNQLKETKIKHT